MFVFFILSGNVDSLFHELIILYLKKPKPNLELASSSVTYKVTILLHELIWLSNELLLLLNPLITDLTKITRSSFEVPLCYQSVFVGTRPTNLQTNKYVEDRSLPPKGLLVD